MNNYYFSLNLSKKRQILAKFVQFLLFFIKNYIYFTQERYFITHNGFLATRCVLCNENNHLNKCYACKQ